MSCFQGLLPAKSDIWLFAEDPPLPAYSYGPYSGYGYNNVYGRIEDVGSSNFFDDSMYTAIFAPVVPGNIFPLGQPTSWVYTGTNGWPALTINDIGLNGIQGVRPVSPPSRDPDIRVSPTLTREAGTGDILVTITVVNRGLLGASNVHLTGVALASQQAPPSVTAAHHYLRSNFPETHTVRFSGLASGTRTILAVRGEYKGGTFGGRFRVTLP